jgi:hypothetical protein
MKKKVLLIAMVLLGLTSAKTTAANAATKEGDINVSTRYQYAQPILFLERGVAFLIFPDGSFDFNTNFDNSFGGDDYYRTRRSSVNGTYEASGTVSRIHYTTPRSNGALIQHDRNGKVRRIGNVFINYDREGRIKRAGSVYMSYQRGHNGVLKQIGGLRVNYNRWIEIVHISGVVNHNNATLNRGIETNPGRDYGYGDFNNLDDDDDFYYYKKATKVKKQKMIKQ